MHTEQYGVWAWLFKPQINKNNIKRDLWKKQTKKTKQVLTFLDKKY